ncbi:MAG TPA: hypothetical protein VFU65_21785 [Actinocrinis sp.]|nr:hypothetical protein [Actinocrinis sp.]
MNGYDAGATNRGDGVQIVGSTVTGNVAGGGNTGVRQSYQAADAGRPDQPVVPADLIAALRALREELERSRSAGQVELEQADAADVHRALDEAEAAAAEPMAQAGVLRRRIGMIVDILGSSATLATAVSTLVSVFQKLPLG